MHDTTLVLRCCMLGFILFIDRVTAKKVGVTSIRWESAYIPRHEVGVLRTILSGDSELLEAVYLFIFGFSTPLRHGGALIYRHLS